MFFDFGSALGFLQRGFAIRTNADLSIHSYMGSVDASANPEMPVFPYEWLLLRTKDCALYFSGYFSISHSGSAENVSRRIRYRAFLLIELLPEIVLRL